TGSNGGGDVAQRGGRNASGERRGIPFVIGVKDQCDIERLRDGFVRRRAVQHVSEISGVAEIRAGGYDVVSAANAMETGDEGRSLRGEADRFSQVRLSR